MTTKGFFSLEEVFIEKFIVNSQLKPASLGRQRADLKRFSRQYRELDLGTSFLNESNSCRWLTSWRDHFAKIYSHSYLSTILNNVCRWTNFLFLEGIIDDDAFFYLKTLKFFQRKQEAPHLTQNLQRFIYEYGIGIKQNYGSATIKSYFRYLHDFNLFQNLWLHRKDGWECIQDESLILAWIENLGQCRDERNLSVAIRVLGNFLEFLRNRDILAINVVEKLYKHYPRCGWRGLARALQSNSPSIALDGMRARPQFTSPWGNLMVEFLNLKRKLGNQSKKEQMFSSFFLNLQTKTTASVNNTTLYVFIVIVIVVIVIVIIVISASTSFSKEHKAF